jgi:hypothetical protein
MPAGCPAGYGAPQWDEATWRLEADPMLDVTVKEDPSTELISVVGSYAATATSIGSELWYTPDPFTHSGTCIRVVSSDYCVGAVEVDR